MIRFNHVTPRVPVADLGRTIDFYKQLLGFHEDVLFPENAPTFCILQRDGVTLGFFELGSRPDARAGGSCDIYVDVDDVSALHESLDGKIAIEWGPEVYFYGRREFAVRDPDGYLLIFTEETDDPATCAEE